MAFKGNIYWINASENSTNSALSELFERTKQSGHGYRLQLSVLSLLKLYLGPRFGSTNEWAATLLQEITDENKPAGMTDTVFFGRSLWELQLSGINLIKSRGGGFVDYVSYTPLNLESSFYSGLVSKSITTLLPVDREYVEREIIPVIKELGFSPEILGYLPSK
jgi:hypothetical protein